MKQQISKWLSILLPIFLGVFLIVYTYQKFTPGQILEIKSYFKNANYSYIVLGIFIAFLGNASRAYRWKFMLEHLGYKTSFYNNFMAVNICYLLNLSVPKSGEISRAVILKKYENVPFDKGFGTIVAERIVDMIVLLTFMLAAFFMQFRIVKEFILDKIPMQKLLVFASVATIVGVGLLLVYFYSKLPWILALKQKISGLKEGVMSIVHMEKKMEYLLHTIFIWFSYLIMFYITLFVIPETSSISLGATMTAFVVGSIAIAFTNSGFGSYPFLISKILLVYGIAETAGNAFGWIVWTSQMLLVVLLGVLSFLLLPVFNRSK
ncbi:MAG TPA: lysylphosphatidylglycerol synthase transmembrane domain-containing protein [Flavobacterium sp.]|nr:lysylphosphatidylglycerol synthase transmembrane domain-containing protein [Flavobacterium sp.]HPJ09628.1 lysylphosphatidylglycerol synthase transmembrane domain-containing protein [Flavobacterium sp.]